MGYIQASVLIVLYLCRRTEASRLTLDPSGIKDPENQRFLNMYSVDSFLGHLATDAFKLKMSPKALQSLDVLQNVTKVGVSYAGITEVPDVSAVSEEAFNILSANLTEGSLFLLKALLTKDQTLPVMLQPTDADISETMSFLNAFRRYWRLVDRVAPLEVEEFDPLMIEEDVQEILNNRSKTSEVKSQREPRKFIIPELPFQASEDNLRNLVSNVFVNPRNHESEEGLFEKSVIKAFISKTFEELGLLVYNHEFSSSGSAHMHGREIQGTNVIGTLPGDRWGTAQDVPIVIGGHYDTVDNTTGAIDNASGTSAVIEAARMLTTSGCKFKNSIIFVAFDLEEIGTQGAFMFVKDFLQKLLMPTFGIQSIGGALILDCIANWDPNNGTQVVADAWEQKIVGLKEEIERSNNTGDFLAVMYRHIPDNLLANRLYHYYHGLGDPKYRLQMMSLKDLEETRPSKHTNFENFDFFRSDHFRFWYPSEETPNVSFSALLLTDTGPYRGKMASCYHAPCDTVQNIHPDFGFLSKITQAVAWVAADLALGHCGPSGVFNVPEMFQVSKERRVLEQGPKEEMRPVVSINGILEILTYLGMVNAENVDTSLNKLKHNTTHTSILLNTPLHRFSVPTTGEILSPSSFTKLTISIHGENSTYLIPLRVASNNVPDKNTLSTTNDTSVPVTTTPARPVVSNPPEKNITASLKVA